MKELIEALQIMLKHGDVDHPSHCEHDTFYIFPAKMDFTDDELKRLEEIGFSVNDGNDGFYSFRYGSC